MDYVKPLLISRLQLKDMCNSGIAVTGCCNQAMRDTSCYAGQTNLEMVNEGYHAIKLEGCEFLIASDNDGRLNLQDIYVQVWCAKCCLKAMKQG